MVGLVLLLMVMQILALAFPNRWYLKLFWFEGAAPTQHRAREAPLLRQTSQACISNQSFTHPTHACTYAVPWPASADRLSFYFTRKTIIADRPLAIYYVPSHFVCVCGVCGVWYVVCATCRVCVCVPCVMVKS